MDMKRHIKILFALFITALVSGCATNPVTGDSDFVLLSEDSEISIGRKNHPAIIKKYGLYDDPAMQKYVQKIGAQLAIKSHRSNLIYRFFVLDSHEVNAFALPGGYIYITRGLIAYLNSEAELAAILGHELGHVTARHGVRQQSAATLGGLLGVIISSKTGSRTAADASNLISNALISGYGREHELQADKLGAEYLARTVYKPEAMIDVIRILKNQELLEKEIAKKEQRDAKIYHGVFATHPDNDTRLQEVVKKASLSKHKGIKQQADNRPAFLKRLNGMVFGDSEQQGIRRGKHFYHKALNFSLSFPDQWRIDNRPDAIIAQAPANDGFIQVFNTDLNRKLTPKAFIQKRLNIDNFRNGKAINPNGLKGYSQISSMSTPYGERQTRVATLFHKDKAYVFYGAVKSKGQLSKYENLFFDTINSFHPLKPTELKLAEPLRLKIITTPKNTTLHQLAKQSRITNYPEQQLRLLNNLYPSGELTSGDIKIVE